MVCSIAQLQKQLRNVTHHREGSVTAIRQSALLRTLRALVFHCSDASGRIVDKVEGKQDTLTEREANRA